MADNGGAALGFQLSESRYSVGLDGFVTFWFSHRGNDQEDPGAGAEASADFALPYAQGAGASVYRGTLKVQFLYEDVLVGAFAVLLSTDGSSLAGIYPSGAYVLGNLSNADFADPGRFLQGQVRYRAW